MHTLILSPHLDDAALSLGGLIWQVNQAAVDKPLVFTVCAGYPEEGELPPFARALHARWEIGPDPVGVRIQEDRNALARLDASGMEYDLPDCIYRRVPGSGLPLINHEIDLFQPLPSSEMPQVHKLVRDVSQIMDIGGTIVSPLAVGNHIDHSLARRAAEILAWQRQDLQLRYYLDFPYIKRHPDMMKSLLDEGWQPDGLPLSDKALDAWTQSVGEYKSQISTFWESPAEMSREIREYASLGGGHIWRPPWYPP